MNDRIFCCMECGKDFEYDQVFIEDADGNVSCPYCGSGDVSEYDELDEDYTQASNVSPGKIDIFGAQNKKDEDWYKALYELKDWEDEDKEE